MSVKAERRDDGTVRLGIVCCDMEPCTGPEAVWDELDEAQAFGLAAMLIGFDPVTLAEAVSS